MSLVCGYPKITYELFVHFSLYHFDRIREWSAQGREEKRCPIELDNQLHEDADRCGRALPDAKEHSMFFLLTTSTYWFRRDTVTDTYAIRSFWLVMVYFLYFLTIYLVIIFQILHYSLDKGFWCHSKFPSWCQTFLELWSIKRWW